MGLFDIDISQQAKDLLPIAERGTNGQVLSTSLLSGVGRANQLHVDYKEGALSAFVYSAGTYAIGDRVIYNNGSVYESLIDSNTDEPSTSNSWLKVQTLFIGADEAQYYGGGMLSLEYALNIRFMTSFNAPPSASDIYIERLETVSAMFQVGATEAESSMVYSDRSSQGIEAEDITASNVSFTIWIPQAVFDALGTNDIDREKIVREFANRYVIAGVFYNVDTY